MKVPSQAIELPTLSSLDLSEEGRRRRAEALTRLLDEWMADKSGYDEETWPKLRDALDRNRSEYRKLFDG